MNLGEIQSATTNSVPPLVASATLGAGNMMVSFETDDPRRTSEVIAMHRPVIDRGELPSVSAEMFRDPEFDFVSGLLVASVNPFSIPMERGGFEFLHNPRANHQLAAGWLRKGVEYRLEGNELIGIDHGERALYPPIWRV